LLAGTIAAVLAEQLHSAGIAKLAEMVAGHGGHAPLVLLARPVDIEIAEARDLETGGRQHAAYDVVEEQLGIPVNVERPLVLRRLAEYRAIAVCGRGRCVEKPRPLALTDVEQILRAAVIRLEHVAPVVLHRVGASPLVEDGIDAPELTQGEAIVEPVAVEVIAEARAEKVAEFRALGEVID